MEIHHIGIACNNIEEEIVAIRKLHRIKKCSEILFDEEQNARVCLLTIQESIPIELVSGTPVVNLLSKGITYYHLGFGVTDIQKEARRLTNSGAIQVSHPKPAILFSNKMVAFFYSPYGLIELVEC